MGSQDWRRYLEGEAVVTTLEHWGKYGRNIDIRDPNDEILAKGTVHFEAMDDGQWYVRVQTPDRYTMLLYFTAVKKGLLRVNIVEAVKL